MARNILVIEDDLKHLDDAKKFFADKDVKVIYARTFRDAGKYLPPNKVEIDGVISDIYFPLTYDSTWSNPEPIGVRVGIVCRDHNIPCVLNTAGYHHGARYEWIFQMSTGAVKGFPPIVDASSDYHKEAETKDWEGAFKTLLSLIGKSTSEP